MNKILYGVQATGNGHITRARLLVPWLRRVGFDVDVLISGRERTKLFGLDELGHYRFRHGFTFALDDGRVDVVRTLLNAQCKRFWRDVRNLSLDQYEYILTDFEPVTAWSARLQGRECIGIGHQYAFQYAVPKQGFDPVARAVMRWFAPVSLSLGLHWDGFGAPILPPIVDTGTQHRASLPGRYLVYLPFDSITRVMRLLNQFPEVQFTYYCAVDSPQGAGHIRQKPYSRSGFQEDLAGVEGVICGAGFELPSEALHAGKKLLVQPLRGQFEQASNAKALQLLSLASVMHDLDPESLRAFICQPPATPMHYPNVAKAVAFWLQSGARESVDALSNRLWQAVAMGAPQAASGINRSFLKAAERAEYTPAPARAVQRDTDGSVGSGLPRWSQTGSGQG
ncbi:glycosyltransferase family protein [Simiduia agarivorans]|uniref:Glycosyltransferase n=1 Tax=Simiduia agarivorans (strain DSM 21679 / JCM 13881 / BCRC 17597 / SA1) TaxID=1117647 RepID=K4L1F6_SIMAS|nr:glycosyltransferase family protein [Simiduia agarivorans]AFV00008.1 hypothetical protein M5M_14355 [Simiduia agarivorans SA1 = DSM 21679]